jgi:hypothetical protein
MRVAQVRHVDADEQRGTGMDLEHRSERRRQPLAE